MLTFSLIPLTEHQATTLDKNQSLTSLVAGQTNQPVIPMSLIQDPHIDACLLWPNERGQARFKVHAEDFIVKETLPFPLSQDGEHLYLYIEKRQCTTQFVLQALAKHYTVHPKVIGYSGLKDKQAVTQQYFSIQLPKDNARDLPQNADFRVLSQARHLRKLKIGSHRENQFSITLRECDYDAAWLNDRCALLCQQGTPNFFDQQRFGYHNLATLNLWSSGQLQRPPRHHEKSLLISSLRSALFNAILADRLKSGTDLTGLAGDWMMLSGTHSIFRAEHIDADITTRLAAGDISPTGLLLGNKPIAETSTLTPAESQIQSIIAPYYVSYMALLDQENVAPDRRALRVKPSHFQLTELPEQTIRFDFHLPRGSYASGFLAQLFAWKT